MTGQDGMYIGPSTDPHRYQIWSRLGSGGEGEVWHGTQQLTDGAISVAIKAYHADRLRTDEPFESLVARVDTQVARLRELRDPGIAVVHESFVGRPLLPSPTENGDEQIVYLVMGRVDGMPLSEWFADDKSPAGRLGVLNDAAAALDKLHDTGQVHGDIKPSNLLVETLELPDGKVLSRAVLVDFGLMRQIIATPPSVVMGTPGFTAPELNGEGGYSPASDFYAFACVCAWLVCGGPPGHDVAGALRAAGLSENIVGTLLSGLDPDPETRSQQLSSGIAGWLSRLQSELSTTIPIGGATEPMPDSLRPTTSIGAANLAGQHAALRRTPEPAGQLQDVSPRPRRPRRRPLPWILFFAALVVIAGLLTLRPWQEGDPDTDTAAAGGGGTGSDSNEPSPTTPTSDTTLTTTTSTTAPDPTIQTTTTSVSSTTPTTPPAELAGEDLISLLVPSAVRCGWHNFNGRPWAMDDDINILGERFSGPSCWLGPRSAESSSYVEFELGARFTSATVSVGVDSGVPAWGDPEQARSAADAEFVYRFLEVSGSSERELHPEVVVNLGQPSTLTFDVSGVARLRVFVTHSSGGVATVSVYDGELT